MITIGPRLVFLARIALCGTNPFFSLCMIALAASFSTTGAWAQVQRYSVDSTPTLSNDDSCAAATSNVYFQPLARDFFDKPPAKTAAPFLVVGSFDAHNGLLVGYQSKSGKRIVLRSKFRADGTIFSEAAHYDSEQRATVRFMKPIVATSPATGLVRRSLEVLGEDLLQAMPAHAKQGRRERNSGLLAFMVSDLGEAFAEAIPVMYAAFESVNAPDSAYALQSPFGAALSALQLNTGSYYRTSAIASVLGSASEQKFRANCSAVACQYRGNRFTIRENGLFDVISKFPGTPFGKVQLCGRTMLSAPIGNLLSKARAKNGDGDCTDPGGCFGYCGNGCFTPGNVQTPECYGHDLCVCKWGDLACLFDVPSGEQECEGCASLIDAICSFLERLFGGLPSPDEEIPEDFIWW